MHLLLGLGLLILILTIYLALLSRDKKSATGALNLIGATGVVQSTLEPEGAVIINGELWRARAATGGRLEANHQIRVVGLAKHLVLVEPLSDKL